MARHVSATTQPLEFPRWSVCVHSCSVPALPGVSQGSAACLRTAQPPGVPKVACACAFKSSCSVPALPRVSHGGAACLRTQEYPKVAQHASALHSPQEFPRWRVHVHSWLCCHFSLVAAHALTHARAGLLARACTRIRARLRMHTCGHTPTSAEKAPGPRTPRARRRCPTYCPIASPPLSTAHVLQFSGCCAAATARAAPRQSMPTNPSAMGRIPAPTRPAERHDRSYGPRNTGLAMTVKSFFQEEEEASGRLL